MSTEERLEALYKLLGSCMPRDPYELSHRFTRHAVTSADMLGRDALAKERLAMDLTTAKIDLIESRTARWQKG